MNPKSSHETILLLSMGYDSLCVWHQMGRPAAVYFDVGSAYTGPEARRYEGLRASHPQLLPIQDVSWLGSHERDHAVLPLRNLVFAVNAASLGYRDVVLAGAGVPGAQALSDVDQIETDSGHPSCAPHRVRLLLL